MISFKDFYSESSSNPLKHILSRTENEIKIFAIEWMQSWGWMCLCYEFSKKL